MVLFLSLFAKIGYVLAIFLWRHHGPKYYGPMVVILLTDLVTMAWKYLGLPWDNLFTPLVLGGYHILLLFWVVQLSRVFKDNSGYSTSVTILLVFTLQLVLISPLNMSDEFYYIKLTTEMMTILETTIAILITSIFIWWVSQADYRRGWVSKIREGKRLMIIDSASAVLLPLLVWSALLSISHFNEHFMPKAIFNLRFLIASQFLGWGWVVLYFRAGWEREDIVMELDSQSEIIQDKISELDSKRRFNKEED